MRPFSLLAALALLLAGPALAGQVLHRPSEGEPGTLDPQKMTSANSIAIVRDLFIGLISLGPDGKPVPGAAESWEISPDGKTWTFHLRHDGKWSNGDPVTAEDFVYSFRRLVDPRTAADDPSDLKQVVGFDEIQSGKEKDLGALGVKAVDPYTLTLALKEPRLALKFLLTDAFVFPLHRATLEKWGNDWTQPGHLVSNGPYVLKSWVPQSAIVLEKNPYFFDAASVKIGEVDWLDAADRDAAVRRYRGGELDWAQLNRNTLPWAKANAPDQLHTALINQIDFIYFNMAKGVLAQDRRIREALNLATDREAIATKIDPLGQIPAYSNTPTVISDYTPPVMPFKSMPQGDRLERAKALMQDAGYGPDHPLKLTISYPTQESTRQILGAIKQMWLKIGVDLQLDNMEWQVFVDKINQRNYDLAVMAAIGSYDDYENGLDNYRSDANFMNWCGYSNPKFDDLFHRGGTATDPATRRELMQQAEAVLLNDYPIIPLDFASLNRLVNPRLLGFVDSVLYPQSRHLSFKDQAS